MTAQKVTEDHLTKVGAFLASGEVVELTTEVLFVSATADAGCLAARVCYEGAPDAPVRLSMFAERVEENKL